MGRSLQRGRSHCLTGGHAGHGRNGGRWLWGAAEKLSARGTTPALNCWGIIHPSYTITISDWSRHRHDWLKGIIFCTTDSRGNRIRILLYFCLFHNLSRLFCRECLRGVGVFTLIREMIVILFWLIGWIGTFTSGYWHRGPLQIYEYVDTAQVLYHKPSRQKYTTWGKLVLPCHTPERSYRSSSPIHRGSVGVRNTENS